MGCPDPPELISVMSSNVGATRTQANFFFCHMMQTMCDGCKSDCRVFAGARAWVIKHTHLWLKPLLSGVQRLLRCEMTAACLTLPGGKRNHLSIQRHTDNVQSDNELGCDICCRSMLVQSQAEVRICGWGV